MQTIDELPLTPKQQRFCDEYFIDLNATAAALRAGYSPATAMNGQLMQAPKIAAYIRRNTPSLRESTILDSRVLLNELAKVAFASMGDYFDADGNIRPIQDLSEDEKAAIWSIDITEKPDGTKTTKIRLNNKLTAMEKLARHTGFYNPEFIPEKVYVYLDKEQMDKWDRLDDNSMDAAAPKARLAPSGFGAVYDEIYCWEDELREREAALDKREAELNGLTLAATAQEGSAESGGKGEELETGVEVGCVVAEMPVKEAHTATTTTDEKKVIGHLPGQYTADGYLIKTDMPADWDKNDPYYDPFARRYVEKKVSSNMIIKSYLPSPDSKVRKAYKNGRL